MHSVQGSGDAGLSCRGCNGHKFARPWEWERGPRLLRQRVLLAGWNKLWRPPDVVVRGGPGLGMCLLASCVVLYCSFDCLSHILPGVVES
jgi:hypothetical protein